MQEKATSIDVIVIEWGRQYALRFNGTEHIFIRVFFDRATMEAGLIERTLKKLENEREESNESVAQRVEKIDGKRPFAK